MYKVKITGVGKYIPQKVLTNQDLEKMVETNDEWITTRVGIKERHIVADDETTASMGAKAAEIAIQRAGLSKEDIDLIIFPTITPDKPFPASACIAQDILKVPHAGTMDLETACSGFIYGLGTAYSFIASGVYKNVLVICSESMSRIVDWTDRNTCVLFGDGAGAAVFSRNDEDDSGIIGFSLGGDGSYGDLLTIDAGGSALPASHETIDKKQHYMKMAGNMVYKVAVRTMADDLEALMNKHGVHLDQVKLLIPHQANVRIIDAVIERFNFPRERTMINIDKYANTSAATIPIALEEALEQGKIRKGDIVAMTAFGGGFTWGSALIKW